MRMFPAKDTGEALVYTLNFAGTNTDLVAGETLTAVVSVTISLVSGVVDAGMASMLSGTAQISGNTVTQLVINGITGNRYGLTARCTTSAGRTVAEGGIITITPAYLQ